MMMTPEYQMILLLINVLLRANYVDCSTFLFCGSSFSCYYKWTKMSYAVVKFINEENSYSEIPTSWIHHDKKHCYWPYQKNFSQLIARNAPPETSWSLEPISIEGFYSSLKKARKIAEDPDYTSQEEECRQKRIPKPVRFEDCESSGDAISSDNENSILPPLPRLTQEKENIPQDNINIDLSKVKILQMTSLQSLDTFSDCASNTGSVPTSSQTSSDVSDMLTKIYKLHFENNYYLKTILEKVDQIQINAVASKPASGNMTIILENIPFKTIEKLVEFESNINETISDALTEYIKKIGGRNSKDNIIRCVKAIYSNELASLCSWLGLRGNFKLKDTKIMVIIKEVMKSEYIKLTESEFEKIVSEWVRLASTRIKTKKSLNMA